MRSLIRTAAVAATVIMAVPGSASAADAYWNQQCTNGGWTFNTCASAHVTVSGNTVTLRIWNLAGAPGSNTFANTGFTAVGLSSLGSGLTFKNLVALYPDGTTAYAGWSFANNGSGIPGPVGSNGVVINGAADAIYSQYATSIAGNGNPAVTNWGGPGQFGSGYVSFEFQTYITTCTGNGQNKVCTDTPTTVSLANAMLGLHAQSGPAGQSTGYECLATSPSSTTTQPYPCSPPPPPVVVPEPATMILLATGLMALAGADTVRRRRKKSAL